MEERDHLCWKRKCGRLAWFVCEELLVNIWGICRKILSLLEYQRFSEIGLAIAAPLFGSLILDHRCSPQKASADRLLVQKASEKRSLSM
jgi:hypothetical protein